jgi:ABC-type polysaccharide/polyol phosphate export permease
LTSLWSNRRTLIALARHDARRTYAGTTARRLWPILTPLVPFVVLTIVFSLGLRLSLNGAPYVYAFAAAYVPWVLLAAAITGAAGSILEHRHLVKRVRFPVELIPAAPTLTQTLPHLVLLTFTAVACIAAGHAGAAIVTIPYFYLCAILLALGVGLLLASLAVLARDVTRALPAVLQVWFWVTPIAWTGGQLPAGVRHLLDLNPAAYVVSGYRHALMPHSFPAPTPAQTGLFWLVAALVLASGIYVFQRLRPHFWEAL